MEAPSVRNRSPERRLRWNLPAACCVPSRAAAHHTMPSARPDPSDDRADLHLEERLRARLEDVLDPTVHDAETLRLRRFSETDTGAAALVARQRRLEGWLEDALAVPVVDVPRPTTPVPAARPRSRWMNWAAAAAMLVATGSFWAAADVARRGAGTTPAPQAAELAEARRVAADRLVGLTSGWEVVAMRRPVEGR